MEQYMPIVWIGFAIFMLLCEGRSEERRVGKECRL